MNAGRKVEKEGDQELTREPMRVSGFIMMLMGAFASRALLPSDA